jgi:hypothetical protein
MKHSCLKYMLLSLSITVLCTDAQALSTRAKAALKSGAAGTLYSAAAVGAGLLVRDKWNEFNEVDELRGDNRLKEIVGGNSICLAVVAGYASFKAAQKAVAYFKHVKQIVKDKQESKKICIAVDC